MSDHWKQKYFDALEEAEKTELELQRVAKLIRLAVSRLSAPVTGMDRELDGYLDQLRAGVRSSPVSASVENLLDKVTDVVSAMDGSFKSPSANANTSAAPQPVPVPAEKRFLALLERLDQGLLDTASVKAMQLVLAAPVSDTDWPAVLGQMADLLSEAASSQSRQVTELKGFLGRLTTRLKEIDQSLEGTEGHFSQNLERGEEMAHSVNTDLDRLTTDMAQATDLAGLRDLVELRTETIHTRLHGFIDHERDRFVTQSTELRDLRRRVSELESSAGSLKSELDSARKVASHDALTGLLNRMAYDQRVAAEIVQSGQSGQPLSLIVCDIDHFKNLNDTLGHLAGDRVLASVAKVISGCVRKTDWVARYGGEEFVVLLPGSDAATACRAAEKIRADIAGARFQYQQQDVAVTLSCGYTQWSGVDTAETMFERADRFLYEAKSGGRNCVRGGTTGASATVGMFKAG